MHTEIRITNKHLVGLVFVLVTVTVINHVESYGSGNPTSVGHTWDEIDFIPASIADNVDNDILGQMNCPEGTTIKFVPPGYWTCWPEFYQPRGPMVYKLYYKCDRDNTMDGELVLSPKCIYERWRVRDCATCPYYCPDEPNCAFTGDIVERREPRCAGTSTTCSTTNTYYWCKYECNNEPFGYLIDTYGWYT